MAEERILCHKDNFEEVLEGVKSWDISNSEKNKVKQYFKDYRSGKVTNRVVQNPERSLLRYLFFLKASLENLKGFTLKHVEKFRDDLLSDKIKHGKGTYSFRSKKDLMANLKRYLDWRGNGNVTKILTIKITLSEKDFEMLEPEEIKKFIEETNALDKKYMISILSMSGMRAEEFHNLRYSDFILPKGDETFLKLRIRSEFSKTKGRTIALHDKNVLKIAKRYLNQRLNEGMKPEDVVFPITYRSGRTWLKNNSKKILGKEINHHQFRHIRATQLSSEMNRQQLCIYFGWRFSSNMPDKYIQRSGVEMKQIDEKFSKANVEELEEKLKEQDEQIKKLIEEKDKTTVALVDMANKISEISKLQKKK